jgi:hypothetical protein
VHPAVGHQAENVQAAGVAGGVHERAQHGVVGERAVGHGVVYPLEILRHHSARTQVEVPDLRVAHLTGRQAHGLSVGG